MTPLRLGILATHPVQYQVPWYRALAAAADIDLTVLYAMIPDAQQQGVGFERPFEWDVPLLGGYCHQLLRNAARHPRLGHFRGCDTPQIADELRRRSLDALIVQGWQAKTYLQAVAACRHQRIPVIVRAESNALKPRPWYIRLLHRLLVRQFAACLVIGKGNAAFYRRNGVPAERLFPGPYCVDNTRFAAEAERLQSQIDLLRTAWQIPPRAVVFLYCGKFTEVKRPLDLLRALHETTRHAPAGSVHVLMVGDGALRGACERYAGANRLPVTFAGFLNQSEVARAYAASDCLILPSDYETWGLVVNEAMASGRPAIVSDRVGCHPDLIEQGETGFVFPYADVAALARLLSDLSRDREALKRLGRGAAARVSNYSVSTLVDGTTAAARFVTRRGEAVRQERRETAL